MCNPAVDQLEAQRVFQTFLTGLREGLEAALVVSILLTFLVRGDHRDRIPALWAGVGVAIAVSFGFGAVLHFTSANMSFEAQEAFGGILSIVAVGFVTWMVFWMKRASRTIKGDLTHKMEAALKLGASGVLFLYPTLQAQGSGIGPALGAVLGIATAVGIGFLLYRGAVNLNLATFFKVTGAGLIVIAAGVLAYGVHDLQEAAILPGLNTLAWDINGWDITSWYGTLLKGIFNVGPQMTVLEVITYVAYLVPTMVLFLRPLPASDTGSTSSAPGEHTATAAPTLTPPTTVPAGGHS